MNYREPGCENDKCGLHDYLFLKGPHSLSLLLCWFLL